MSRVPDIFDFPGPNQARWGLGTTIGYIPTGNMQRILGQYANNTSSTTINIANIRHPIYDRCIRDWQKWRLVYEAGDEFIDEFTQRFSNRESPIDFNKRKSITPIPAYASSGIDEVKNAIFQRTADIIRRGGSDTYQKAVAGDLGGVDLHGGTMNWFIGQYILPELLVMQKVGVYVDSPDYGVTQADKGSKHPYYYTYRAEDIFSWTYNTVGSSREFSSVLLRDYQYVLDPTTNLPIREVPRLRHVFIGQDGYVKIQFYTESGALDSDLYELKIKEIPFHTPRITQSLMKNVANTQIALLNMESSDVSYALKSNFPFYVEQYDAKSNNPFLRTAQSAYNEFYNGSCPPGSATTQGITGLPPGSPEVTPASDAASNLGVLPSTVGEHIDVGATQGRRYPLGAERPGFISPPAEPLRVSMEKQRELKTDIRTLIHLALASVQSASAESKLMDRQSGLESGLANIGLELEHTERRLAELWAMYENSEPAQVFYPKHWSLKSVKDAKEEITQLESLRDSLPSKTFKSEVNKLIADTAIGTRIPADTLTAIYKEIDAAKGGSSDPKTINIDLQNGILSQQTAVKLRGYPEGESLQAAQDHAERLARIMQAQTSGEPMMKVAKKEAELQLEQSQSQIQNPAARGVPDLSVDPTAGAAAEKVGSPGRGPAL